jgi:hypothetical protein
MEAKELMIGDWCAYGVNCKGRVTALTESMITMSVDGNEINGLYMLMPDMIRPIPLTEEILAMNFGEDPIDYDHEMREHFHVIETWAIAGNEPPFMFCHRNDWAAIKTIGIYFVHELQHILRLCNIDKEISI